MEKIGNSTKTEKKKTRSTNLVYSVNLSYTGGRGRTGTSVRTLDSHPYKGEDAGTFVDLNLCAR